MAARSDSQVLAGAAAVEVTPEPGCYLAGLGHNRVAASVHDPLWAKALALGTGELPVVLVAVDCFGLLARQVADVAARIEGLPTDHLVVCATHTHSGPDTIGLWGPDQETSGYAAEAVDRIVEGAAEAARSALADLRPARLTFAKRTAPDRTAVNIREPEVIDDQIGLLRATDLDSGEGIATLVNWACHPETLQGRSLVVSSDYPDALRRRLERALGGVCLYVNGALGAKVTVASAADSSYEADRIGTAIADTAASALQAIQVSIEKTRLQLASQTVWLPIVTPALQAAVEQGLIPGAEPDGGQVRTRVTAFSIGPATFLTLPGEPQPAVGKYLKRAMGRPHRFLLGLANDEIGHILRRADHDNAVYQSDASLSLGPDTARRLALVARQLIEEVEG